MLAPLVPATSKKVKVFIPVATKRYDFRVQREILRIGGLRLRNVCAAETHRRMAVGIERRSTRPMRNDGHSNLEEVVCKRVMFERQSGWGGGVAPTRSSAGDVRLAASGGRIKLQTTRSVRTNLQNKAKVTSQLWRSLTRFVSSARQLPLMAAWLLQRYSNWARKRWSQHYPCVSGYIPPSQADAHAQSNSAC